MKITKIAFARILQGRSEPLMNGGEVWGGVVQLKNFRIDSNNFQQNTTQYLV